MVAIAVSLSVALFVSTTGYLSGLTSSLGNVQPGQNQAAQALFTIENIVAKAYTTGFTASPTNAYVELFVKSVGGVSLTLGSLTMTTPPSNAGQRKSFSSVLTGTTWSTPYADVYICSEGANSATCEKLSPCSSSGSLNVLTTLQNTGKVWIEWCVDTGTATGPAQSSTQLQDTTQSWATNQWAGYIVTITSGLESGETATVCSNTSYPYDTLTITTSSSCNPPTGWTTALSGSLYSITLPAGLAPKSGDAFQIQVSSTVGASNIVTISVP